MRLIKLLPLIVTLSLLTGCLEDLNPDSTDLRSEEDLAPKVSGDFSATTSLNDSMNLADELLINDAIVLYFTMWCPLCDSHMSHIQNDVMGNYPNVQFYMVDYVSGNVSQSRSSQVANGFGSLQLLVDNNQSLLNQYTATMASVIVIDDQNQILLNEDYKNGARLIDVLDNLGTE